MDITPEIFEMMLMFGAKPIDLTEEDFYQGEIEMPKPETRCLYTYTFDCIFFGESDGIAPMSTLITLVDKSRMKSHCMIADIEVCLEFFNPDSISLSQLKEEEKICSIRIEKNETDSRKYELKTGSNFLIDKFEYLWEAKLFRSWLIASGSWDEVGLWISSDYQSFQNILTKFKYNIFRLIRLLPPQYRKLMYWRRA